VAYGGSLAARERALFNIFDMMRTAQGGIGMDAVARQFGLSQEQAQRAFAALMPAFALGLQRSAADPAGFANLMRLMSPPFAAPQAPPPAQGGEALGQILGSAELTRRVAEQAAHWSGVSAQVLQQMMPIFAAALVGSLSQFSEVMRAQAAGGQPAAAAPTPADPYAAWAEMMRGFMAQAAPAAPPSPTSAAAAAQPPREKEKPAQEAAPPPPEGGEAAWSQAMASGRDAQAQYLASLQNIFDQFWGAGPDRR
jgi:hypothetical protein